MRSILICTLMVLSVAGSGFAEDESAGFVFEQGLDVQVNGVTWLRTVMTPFLASHPEYTYKVYTHLYDFERGLPITKGPGGKYPHHRGLFIGWNHTHIGGTILDSWHMRASRSGPDKERFATQEWVEWLQLDADENSATQVARIHWRIAGEDPFLEEIRTLRAFSIGSLRAVDFVSSLRALTGDIALRGDPQHAGMQVRMAQEVVENEQETQFILPEGAQVRENDVVDNTWWACASMPVRGKRYWVLHLTSPALATGIPQYSIRAYGRFGAFFEPELKEGVPLDVAFRIIWTEQALDQEQCAELFRQYSESVAEAAP